MLDDQWEKEKEKKQNDHFQRPYSQAGNTAFILNEAHIPLEWMQLHLGYTFL